MRQQAKKILSAGPDFGFSLIAIICSLKDYRLAHFLNKDLELCLTRSPYYPEYKVAVKEVDGYISLFSAFVEESETEYYFFSNKGSAGPVIPEMRDVDHFLLVVPASERLVHELLFQLCKMERIEAAFNLEVLRLKSRENLLFF